MRRIPQCSSACEMSVVARRRRGPEQVRERGGDRPQLVEVVERQPVEEDVELRRDDVDRIADEDACCVAHDLHDREVGDALAVREAIADADVRLLGMARHLVQ